MSDEQSQNNNRYVTKTDASGFDAASALEIRLNTDPIIRRFELDLKGLREEVETEIETGIQKIVFKSNGNPLANKMGQQAIMGHINSVINHQNVQGNFKVSDNGQIDLYADFLIRTRKGIAADLMINRHIFGIGINNYRGIMAKIMRLVEAIASRTINDGERRTFARSTTIQENNTAEVRNTQKSKVPFI